MSGNYTERDLVRVMNVRDFGGGQFVLDDGRFDSVYDFTATAIYVGSAPLGTPTSAASWTIKKIGLDASGNPTNITWTPLGTAVWDDRLTETYS